MEKYDKEHWAKIKAWVEKSMSECNFDMPPIPMEERMSMEELDKCLPDIDTKSTKAAFDYLTKIFDKK